MKANQRLTLSSIIIGLSIGEVHGQQVLIDGFTQPGSSVAAVSTGPPADYMQIHQIGATDALGGSRVLTADLNRTLGALTFGTISASYSPGQVEFALSGYTSPDSLFNEAGLHYGLIFGELNQNFPAVLGPSFQFRIDLATPAVLTGLSSMSVRLNLASPGASQTVNASIANGDTSIVWDSSSFTNVNLADVDFISVIALDSFRAGQGFSISMFEFTAVPEPSTCILAAMGMSALTFYRRRVVRNT
ncbi:MAG TPA: PEP-CTERM sorting domain-containing protein [Chryseolinea sp.]